MFAIIGLVVVFGSVIGGFLLEKGNPLVLMQPCELLIIFGSALGTMLVANSPETILSIAKSLFGVTGGSPFTKGYYLESLNMLHDIFQQGRKIGMAKFEDDVDNPDRSAAFLKHPALLGDRHLLHFICDTLRMSASGVVATYDLDDILERDIEVHHGQQMIPVRALQTVADALPGLGIVAAVLGVVMTMDAMGGPPSEIGRKVGAALVGTFLGILLSYGAVSPIAANIEKRVDAATQYHQVLRAGLLAFAKGMPTAIAVECARRTIPYGVRPTFEEMEAARRRDAGGVAIASAA
jgi:chemotaxis protein MotA